MTEGISNLSDVTKINEALLETKYSATIGGDGGRDWSDPNSTIVMGPITRIELHYGAQIDSIKVYYGWIPGEPHGGTGGEEGVFELDPGNVIDRVQARVSGVIDQIQFFARMPDSEGNVQRSELFGRKNGVTREVVAPPGLMLRSISGKADKRVDKLRFNFGRVATIENVQIDPSAFAASVKDPELRVLDQMIFDNPSQTEVLQSFKHSATVTNRTATNWGGTTRLLYGLSATAKATVGVGEFSATSKFEFEQTFTYGRSSEKSEAVTLEWAINFACPANKRSICTVSVYTKRIERIPFTYDVVLHDPTAEDESKRREVFTLKAEFSGDVIARNIVATQSIEDIPERELRKLAVANTGRS
ncbi:jacalin-like lectin [Jiella avicenniae]|uniref:Jacalin-type lectin domain-containing protein n=1 Tax=Jiella avicenniae TaxID=2907202 RepID=A0A9X1P211_9HYPH|nr:hypothetical protein [Jiella avicenniae]MCE7027846.1 hypothetical protein [Jiella avicenniae]